MPVIDAFQESKQETVMKNTWGHLAPIKTKKYYGFIIFTLGEYRNYCCIKSDFKNLNSSPWYYDDLNNFMYKQSLKKPTGYVYKFIGYYIKFKNDNFRFTGKIKRIKL